MPRVWLLLVVCTLGCAGEASHVPMDMAAPEAMPAAESLTGTAGETRVVGSNNNSPHPRRIVYTASVDLVVEDFDGIPGKVADLAEQFGGYVANSNVRGQPGYPRRGSWTIRVPVDRYADLLSEARELGELRSLISNSKDVSEEYYDVEARIRNKQKTEARIVGLLEEATGNLEQVLVVEQKLDQVREEIERMQGRLRVLTDQSSLATVTVSVEQIRGYQPMEEPAYGTRVERAFHGSLEALIVKIADFSIVVVALSPWLAVLVVLGLILGPIVWIAWRVQRRRRKRQNPLEIPVSAEVVEGD